MSTSIPQCVLEQVEPEVCRQFQAVCQERVGKADYAEIFFEAWMKRLDRSEPEFADLAPPALPIVYLFWRVSCIESRACVRAYVRVRERTFVCVHHCVCAVHVGDHLHVVAQILDISLARPTIWWR